MELHLLLPLSIIYCSSDIICTATYHISFLIWFANQTPVAGAHLVNISAGVTNEICLLCLLTSLYRQQYPGISNAFD